MTLVVQKTHELTQLMRDVSPKCFGIKIGDRTDKSTWQASWESAPTAQEAADAQAVIDAFDFSAPVADSNRIDAAFPQTDIARVIFEAFFELTNRVIALEGGNAITRAQLKNWLGSKLP